MSSVSKTKISSKKASLSVSRAKPAAAAPDDYDTWDDTWCYSDDDWDTIEVDDAGSPLDWKSGSKYLYRALEDKSIVRVSSVHIGVRYEFRSGG